jgi:hypothetical protein
MVGYVWAVSHRQYSSAISPWCRVAARTHPSGEEENDPVANDYDELRPDLKESQEDSLEAVRSANAPDPRSVVRELDAEDNEDAEVPGGEIVDAELTVRVIPPGEDEFTCGSCFLIRHRSQIARVEGDTAYCTDCEG